MNRDHIVGCPALRGGEPCACATPPAPSRPCACMGVVTAWVVENLTFALMEKHYGRRVTRELPVAWERCKVCGGSGVDTRP